MSGYATRKLNVRIGSRKWKIRALSDTQQYADPYGEAKRAGICSASWSLFGQLWPASKALARAVRSEEHTSELQSRGHLVCRLLLEKKKTKDRQLPRGM